MKRNYLYWATSLATYFLSAWIVGTYFTHDVPGGLMCATPCLIFGILIGAAIDGYISSKYPGVLYTPYKKRLILAQERQKKREELQQTMLFKMQYMQGLERTISELNEIFKANRELRLTRWIVFRAWYKAQIDHMLQYPDIYHLSVDGDPYNKDEDPLYDPDAPDWEQYDRPHYDEEDDEEDDEDDFDDYYNGDKKSKVSDALAVGMGIGIVNGLTGGAVLGGGSGGN